jgi:hypothetical protein
MLLMASSPLFAQDEPNQPPAAKQPANHTQPDATKSDPAKPDPGKPEPGKSDPGKTSPSKPDSSQPGIPAADAAASPGSQTPNTTAPDPAAVPPDANPPSAVVPSAPAQPPLAGNNSSAPPPINPANPAATPAGNTEVIQLLSKMQEDVTSLKKTNWLKDVIAPLLAPIVAAIAVIVTARISTKTLALNAELNQATLQSKAHEEQRKAIREKLDRFYGPYVQLRGISNNLYEIFSARRTDDERTKYSDKEGHFKTLIALCRGHIFMGVDKVLLDEIIRIGDESAALITKEIGLVEDAELQAGLSRATTHYRIIKLAAERKLLSDTAEFENFTFPKKVDELIKRQIAALNQQLQELEQVAPVAAAGGK